MKKIFDLISLFFLFPFKQGIFLRAGYDAIWPFLSMKAKFWRRFIIPRKKFVVVIGSLGKTTTYHALQKVFLSRPSKQSYSNYGSCLAENVLRSSPFKPVDVFEVGVDRPGEMDLYTPLINPDIVVVTAIGSEHYLSFKTLENTRNEKVKMVKALKADGVAVLNGDDPNVRWMASQTNARIIFYGFGENNDVRASNIERMPSGELSCVVNIESKEYPMQTKLLADHQLYSLLASIAAVHTQDQNINETIARLETLTPAKLRLENIELANGLRIIDDSFKSVIETYELGLKVLKEIPAKRKIAILGDVECPTDTKYLYDALGKLAAEAADHILLIGNKPLEKMRSSINKASGRKVEVKLIGSRIPTAIEELKRIDPGKGDVIYIKGRGTQLLSRITEWLKGRVVRCDARECFVKVENCADCPLLSKKTSDLTNTYIRRVLRF